MVLHWRFITVYGREFGLIESITQRINSTVAVPASSRKNSACFGCSVDDQGFFFNFMGAFDLAFSVRCGRVTEHSQRRKV